MTRPVSSTAAALLATLPDLKAALAGVPRPTRVTGYINCCISLEELEVLSTTPREALTDGELHSYVSNVPNTVGSETDFHYFLPRVLELAATNPFAVPDRSWVIRRLNYVPWATAWTPAQRDAIRTYLNAWWQGTLAETTPVNDVGEVLATLFDVLPAPEHGRIPTTWPAGRSDGPEGNR